MPTRRQVLKYLGTLGLAGLTTAGYGFGAEPMRLIVKRHQVRPDGWPVGQRLRIAVLSDLHACRPWMDPARIRAIADRANQLQPDLIVLLGDYTASHRFVSGQVPSADWASALSGLAAPLGVYAILGNHDWWDDLSAQRRGHGPVFAQTAMQRVGITVMENQAIRLRFGESGFWLAGLGDQLALLPGRKYGRQGFQGREDVPATLAQLTNDEPVIMLAHEPDIFPKLPDRIALTLCGHTHGGQVRILRYSPVVPSRFGNRYAYGHLVEGSKHLVVSGGLGCSILPVRFGVPPEITLVEVDAPVLPGPRPGDRLAPAG